MDFSNDAAKGYLLYALRLIELGYYGKQPILAHLTCEEKQTLLNVLSDVFDEKMVEEAEQYYFDY